MKWLVAFVASLAAFYGVIYLCATAEATPPKIVASEFSISLEGNPQSQVSPGGAIVIKGVGPKKTHYDRPELIITLSPDNVAEYFSSSSMQWDRHTNLDEPKYIKIRIREVPEVTLPTTLTITATYNDVEADKITLSLPKGTYGHNPGERGKYVIEITAGKVDQSRFGKGHKWYEIDCIGDEDHSNNNDCQFDIKNGEHDYFDGRANKRIAQHTCTDEGFFGPRLKKGDERVFDAGRLIIKNLTAPTPGYGEEVEANARCKILSTEPIAVRPIDERYIAPLR